MWGLFSKPEKSSITAGAKKSYGTQSAAEEAAAAKLKKPGDGIAGVVGGISAGISAAAAAAVSPRGSYTSIGPKK